MAAVIALVHFYISYMLLNYAYALGDASRPVPCNGCRKWQAESFGMYRNDTGTARADLMAFPRLLPMKTPFQRVAARTGVEPVYQP